MKVADGLLYTKEHEWVKIEGNKAKVGITDYAQHKLGDITFVEPPESGFEVKAGSPFTGIESVKAASDIYSPISGRIVSFNKELENSPELINSSPYEKGWIVEINVKDPSEASALMDAAAYKKYIEGLE